MLRVSSTSSSGPASIRVFPPRYASSTTRLTRPFLFPPFHSKSETIKNMIEGTRTARPPPPRPSPRPRFPRARFFPLPHPHAIPPPPPPPPRRCPLAAAANITRSLLFFLSTDTGIDAPIPLPNVSSKILAKVIEYSKFHVTAKKSESTEEETKNFDTEFVKVDQATLFELILVRRPATPNSPSPNPKQLVFFLVIFAWWASET